MAQVWCLSSPQRNTVTRFIYTRKQSSSPLALLLTVDPGMVTQHKPSNINTQEQMTVFFLSLLVYYYVCLSLSVYNQIITLVIYVYVLAGQYAVYWLYFQWEIKHWSIEAVSSKAVGDACESGMSLVVGFTALIVIENALFGQILPPLPQVTH